MLRLLCCRGLVFFLLWLPCQPLRAQSEFSIDLLDVKKGLLSNFVTKTVSDDKQFKYFATEAGISRYDGYAFKHYRPTGDGEGLATENIETLFASKSGFLWIGTKTGGLNRLNLKTQNIESWNDVFVKFTARPLRVVSLAQDLRGNLWVGTWNMGCFKVDVAARKVVEYFPSASTIFNIICDRAGAIWFTDAKDLCVYKNESGTLQRYAQSFYLYNICEDTARNRIWFSGNSARVVNLAYFDKILGLATRVPVNFEASFVASMAIDHNMRIWLGSWGDGLFISDPSVSSFQKVNTTEFAGFPPNTNHKAITNIYIDTVGIAWLSTSYGGVLVLYPNKGFKFIANNLAAPQKDYNVLSISSHPKNGMLVGSISQGLFELGAPQQPIFKQNTLLAAKRIKQIYKSDALLFASANEGLFVFRKGLGSTPAHYFPTEKVTSVWVSTNKLLWVGTQDNGLHCMPFDGVADTAHITSYNEFAKGRFQIFNNRINKIIEDKKGNLWVATHAGVNWWDSVSGKFITHKALFGNQFPAIIINDMLLAGKYMYLATPNGLFKIAVEAAGNATPKLQVMEHYSEAGALVNQFICALEADKSGNIWFSSITGISKLNTHSGLLHHFGKQEGVQVKAFHIASSYTDGSGTMYFGGDNGLVFFNPESVVASYGTPKLVITGISINNQPIEVDAQAKKNAILLQAIQYTKRISLGYKSTDIAVQFSVNDFLGTDNVSYAYKLQPNDADWIVLNKKNELSFTGLPAGSYKLSIRANRNSQGWGEPTEVLLRIAYPPWLAWYAWLCYALLCVGCFIVIRRFRLRQRKLQTELQRVQFEKEKEHEINEAKINFFTNISHEFRTPLTLILSPSTELLDSADMPQGQLKKIGLIKSNAQKLLRLVNQLLDFKKSEQGLLALRTAPENINALLAKLVADFEPAARAKNIALALESSVEELHIELDKVQMEMAINNLLSNAIKFTPAQGKVVVALKAGTNEVTVHVRDNGIGIEPAHLEKIFNRFYQVPDAGGPMGGSGIGLAFAKNIVELHQGRLVVSSQPRLGTQFSITLPIQQNARPTPTATPALAQPAYETLNRLPHTLVPTTPAKRPTLLLIDDNEDIRLYLAQLLGGEFDIAEADNGSSGLKMATETCPDLIISDIMMPQMNGIDLCGELKNNMATSHIPIILLTARSSEDYEMSGLKTGADDYIVKPFNPLIVQMRVKNILDNRKKLAAFYLKKIRFEPESDGVVAENLDEIFLKKATDLVNANLQNEDLGIEMMVDRLFMSQSTLFRKIKSLTGLSITGFIRALRIKKSAQLILQTNIKMSDVAFEVGFNDYKYFKKSFQQQFGCLPSEYRQKHAADFPNEAS
ncbi:MAG: hybrid sensor histidine kinase/response regulator [Bacteroidetes bacterium]|nr:MAG: hybrid sensor histidine kinase/response regulator [Bacteroidota bacterium]